jgi:RNA 2',3'-cyclic 3'-phosphodiesterase
MRLFIATSFPADVLRPLNERLDKTKPRLPAASWVRPETQHLTFAFLGEQEEAFVDRIHVEGGQQFDGCLKGCGFFPNKHHARVGWIGAEPRDLFVALADRVRDAVNAAGVKMDQNEFRPHLTLMRIRDRWPPKSLEMFEEVLRDFQSAPFTVHQVTLYLSRLDPRGAVHTPLRTFPLALSA